MRGIGKAADVKVLYARSNDRTMGGQVMSEKPSMTRLGVVQKIIKSAIPGLPEKAEIAVEGADELYREIRIENSLIDEHGEKVTLKRGATVNVTIEADPSNTAPKG
jgi:uncharacterized protein YfaS (alpha-2-macroglobulin family)